ncbi:NusA-like transcription termination signal-binding factor [archaeon]|nr:NusA-like transcription termination signal-binding factor [archaeon]|tara:strand:- start:6047 stop:6445 length:399 start_codon:yes stop_codon:yes gene_type:complete
MKLTIDSIQHINLFEKITRANVKGCFLNNQVIFVVEEGHASKAIGKNGANVKRIENMIKKKIKVVEYSKDVLKFVKNLIYPLNASEIKLNEEVIEVSADTNTKALLIGRNSKNLDHYNDIIKNYFKYEMKVK